MATGGGEANTQYILRITDIAQEPLEVLLPIDGYEEMPLVSLEVAVEKLVHLLPRVQTYAHVAKERCKKPNDNLTQDESASIMLYTMEWKPRDKCLYFALNATLRSKDRENLTPWFLYLRLLFNALFRLPSISRTVFRGVKLDLRKKYVKENTIVWWGFSSCTVAMSALQSEVFLGETDVRTMFTIECLNGKDIRKHSYYSSEGEILLLPATQFKVIDSLKQGSLTIIHLQEIVPCFPLLQPVLPSLECSLVSSLDNSATTNNRKAIDPSGRIGSLYDVYRDCIVKSPYINLDFKKNEDRPPTTRCIIQRGDKIECQNLLQFIGFDDELRLSLLSNISSPMGIASVTEYPYLIDEFTRVLYYSYTIRQEYLPTDINKIKKRIEQSTSKVDGTHIITGIDSGIDLIVILRLMSADSKTIDDILNKIKQSLINDTILSSDVSVDGILSIHIYSNIQHLTEQKTLINVYKTIRQMKKNFADYRPSNYILHSIEMFIPNNNQSSVTFNLLKPTIVQKIEQYLFQFSWINKIWLTTLDDEKSNILNNNLEEQLREIQKQLSRLNEQYKNEKKQIQQLILSIRYGKDSQKIIEHKILNEDVQTTLKNNIDQLIYSITRFKEKRFFIDDLKRRGFDYQNANKYHIQQNDNENIIQQKLIENNQHLRILCSNDSLNNNNLSTLEQLSFKLLNETKLNPHLRLRYVDFTYSSYELDQIKVFPSSNYRTDPNQRPSLVLAKKETPSIDDNTINILLLGKSGVGKSTLINTFLDHLKFNRFEDIQSNRSSVPILISFLRLIKINSEEHSIRFGNCDRNEDYDHPDQSTTQQCKLYHFNLDNNQKLCIIDTPGFGKTHDQYNDDITMQHILSRIINLTHLNAICILIQSDDIQFDDYQICLTKLFHFFGNNAADNILFCFTKTLSKNLNNDQRNNVIKLMIESLSTSNIHFNEKTIFEFDSTYFINSTISHRFTSSIDTSNQISEESWRISKNGWNRLLNYIRQNLRPYSIQQGLQKAQLARLEINQLIRPLLETIRNNIRNFLLSKTGYSNCSIELHPMSLLHPSAICCSCKRNYRQYGPFWIVSDSPHHFRNYCDTGSCDQHQHIRIDYRLEYQYLSNQTNEQSLTTSISEEDLLYRSVRLAHFLLQEHHNTNNDPFLSYLNKMIDDERSICENISSHRVNIALQNQLINFKQNYQREMNAIKQKHNQNDYDIYDLIENVKQIPMIKIQLDAARKMQETNV